MGTLALGALVETVSTASFGASPTDWSIWNGAWLKTATKSAGGSTITNPVAVGSGFTDSFTGGLTMQWVNGSISNSGAISGGIYTDGNSGGSFSVGAGFKLTFPADTTSRNAVLYFGSFAAQAWVVATLSDGSATPLTITTTAVAATNTNFFIVDFNYTANGPGQTLTIQVTMQVMQAGTANVSMQAAAYSAGAAGAAAAPFTFMLLGAGSGR